MYVTYCVGDMLILAGGETHIFSRHQRRRRRRRRGEKSASLTINLCNNFFYGYFLPSLFRSGCIIETLSISGRTDFFFCNKNLQVEK